MGKTETLPLSLRGQAKPAPSARTQGSCIASPLRAQADTQFRGCEQLCSHSDSSSSFVPQEAGSELTVPLQCLTDICAQLPSGAGKGEGRGLIPSSLWPGLCFVLHPHEWGFHSMALNPEAPQGDHKDRHTVTARTYQYPMDVESKSHMRQSLRRHRSLGWFWRHIFDYLTSRCCWSKLCEFLWQRAIVFIKVSSIFSSKEGSDEPKWQRGEKGNYHHKNY